MIGAAVRVDDEDTEPQIAGLVSEHFLVAMGGNGEWGDLLHAVLKHILVRQLRKVLDLDVSLRVSTFQFFVADLLLLGVRRILAVFFLVEELLDNDGRSCLESLVLNELMVDI